ncbi:Dot/Icm T4SS effector AnkY/LegA9 [Legionella cardiaca]|uniref:Ankyrin repeat domain-containing protein n=1 Tax=Legionella cardiaca TaxID=1071983 RepID=A0ABY8AUA7_9GAMM|nr:Dot/Icm T4SS effector AnkY/LegA9 [Legionella cardiaca]WED43344.1 ankyrin repeat domain-containing protein [Legionella cardiaca]
MGKVILVHANCHNPTAKGDFAFAGNIAKDLQREIETKSLGIDVVLVSPLLDIGRFKSLYGDPVDGRVSIEETSVGLAALEQFDAVDNQVVAFIDANRCKHTAAEIIKRVISPETKFLFVGNVNQHAYSSFSIQTYYKVKVKSEQPNLYDYFNDDDMFLGSAGLGSDRLGLPSITKAEDLPTLNRNQTALLPTGEYGFMYLALVDSSKDYKLIAQYIKLSNLDKYVLVGEFTNKQMQIQGAYNADNTLVSPKKTLPQIEYHQSLPNTVMRKMVADSTGALVLSTGVTSTLEAMQDKKLTYYQDLEGTNAEFVAAYLHAVKSIAASDSSLIGCLPQMLMELSNLLFAAKPLSKTDMEQTQSLLAISVLSSKMIAVNQTIIEQANGKIAPRLLGFINGGRSTNDLIQVNSVCASLRKSGELTNPVYDQALRRAASWGRLFELKVLIKFIKKSNASLIDRQDAAVNRTALHWAVESSLDCAKVLIDAGASLNIQDKDGNTPLHKAVSKGDKQMTRLLILAGPGLILRIIISKRQQQQRIQI